MSEMRGPIVLSAVLALTVMPAMLPSAAAARPAWTSGTFVYADLCTDPNGGLAGRRVTVRRWPNGDGVTYEAASGTLGAAVPAEALSFDDERREIAFTIESETGPVSFRGTVATDRLAGTIVDASGEHPLRLRRVLRPRLDEACRALPQDPETTGSTN